MCTGVDTPVHTYFLDFFIQPPVPLQQSRDRKPLVPFETVVNCKSDGKDAQDHTINKLENI